LPAAVHRAVLLDVDKKKFKKPRVKYITDEHSPLPPFACA
jgi:hypothetical protein